MNDHGPSRFRGDLGTARRRLVRLATLLAEHLNTAEELNVLSYVIAIQLDDHFQNQSHTKGMRDELDR